MNYHEVKILMDHPAVALLRSQNAAMVLGFLFHAFKAQHRITLPEGQIRALLDVLDSQFHLLDPQGWFG